MRDTLEHTLKRLHAGDRLGLERLYELSSGQVYRLITDILGTNDAASDVFKEVYTSIWQDRAEWKTRMGPNEKDICCLANRLALRALYARGDGSTRVLSPAEQINQASGGDVQ